VFQAANERRFFHWPLAFPEVFAAGGFDVILGNPPFMGGLKISTNFGDKYWEFITHELTPFSSTSDLCAAFFRRAFSSLVNRGALALIATNTLGQGDTRKAGLAEIKRAAGTVTFARRFVKWPGRANVEVNLLPLVSTAMTSQISTGRLLRRLHHDSTLALRSSHYR
jgi:Eco57I restriction-modification methylase